MMDLRKEAIEHIISRLLDNANDTLEEYEEEKDDFYKGKKLAYYEMLDTLKTELKAYGQELQELGLKEPIEKFA